MITIITGAPGHGKSYTAVKLIDQYVHDGKYVVTNVPLHPQFPEQMAKRHTFLWRFRKKALAAYERKVAHGVHICTDIEDIMRVRFSGKGEGRGKVVIDESHRVMNVRGSIRGKGEEAQKRKVIVAYASGHRHYGADIDLITQATGNIDMQVRNLIEFEAAVRNFRRLPLIGWFTRLLPGGQLFLRITWWNDKAKTKAGIAIYTLNKRLAGLYDTHGLAEHDWPDNAIVLPSHPDERPNVDAGQSALILPDGSDTMNGHNQPGRVA